jgi:hypothetical protein
VIGEPWFPGLTLKTVLHWDLYWNKCTLYIKIETLLKRYYMYSTLFIELNPKRLVCSYVSELRSLVINSAHDISLTELSPSSEAANCAATQELPSIL